LRHLYPRPASAGHAHPLRWIAQSIDGRDERRALLRIQRESDEVPRGGEYHPVVGTGQVTAWLFMSGYPTSVMAEEAALYYCWAGDSGALGAHGAMGARGELGGRVLGSSTF